MNNVFCDLLSDLTTQKKASYVHIIYYFYHFHKKNESKSFLQNSSQE